MIGNDTPGAENIPKSPMTRDQRASLRLEVFKSRGMMPICRTCRRSCKVLRGSPGTSTRFFCYQREEDPCEKK